MDKLSTHREVWNLYERKHLCTRPQSTRKSLSSIGKWLLVYFGGREIAGIGQTDIDTYIACRPVLPATAAHEVRVMLASWAWAAKRGLLNCAVPKFDLPEAHEPRQRWLSEAEIKRVLDAAARAPTGSAVRLFVWIALETAARRDAIETLTWSQVDFDNGLVHFLPDGAKQTSKRRVTVPMSDALRAELLAAYGRGDLVRVDLAGSLVLGVVGDTLYAMKRLGERAGVPGLTPHVFRHTAATHMARRGVPLWTIASILGNTVAQVEKTYAKFQPEFGREAINWRKSA